MILGSTGLDRFIAGQHAVEVQHPVAGGPRDPQPDRRTVCIPLLPTLIFHAPSHGHTHTHTHTSARSAQPPAQHGFGWLSSVDCLLG